ncbi:transcription factor, contains a PHD finger motif [Basidiobolus ranarum]|uniref:Transcription factor, contains a PHD finger motif n=1 Tax=Basidiobolus ranarum TaxID=34480 RepID=A0ABR2W0G8_9FUNG
MNISTLISNDGEDTRSSQNLNTEPLIEVSEEVAQHESPLSATQLTNPVASEQISITNDTLTQFPPNSETPEMMFDPGENSGIEDSSGLFIQEGNTPQLEDMYPNGEPSYEVGSPGLGTPQQLMEPPTNDRIQTPETDEIRDDSKVESPSSIQKSPLSTEYETDRKWTDQKVLMQSPEPMESSNPDLTNEGIVDSLVESPIELKTQNFSTNSTKVSQVATRIPLPPVKKRHLLNQYRNSMSFEEETVSKANLDITYDNESSHTERIRDSSLDHSDSEDKEILIESEPEVRHTYGGKLPITHGVAPSHQSSTCSSSSSSEEDVLDGTQGQKRLKSNHGTQKMLHELSDSENSNSDSSGSVDLGTGTGAGGKTVTDLIHRSHSFSTVTRQPRPVRRATIAKSRESSYEMNENSGVESEKLPPSRAVEPCYCGDMTKLNEHNRLPSIKCSSCRRRCHLECIHYTQPFVDNLLLGDDFYFFKCHECNGGKELFQRLNLSWVDVVHIALFNLTHGEPTCNIKSYEDGRLYFHVKQEVCRFVNEHWDRFWNKIRSETWQNSVAGTLSTNSTNGRFESGNQKYDKTGMWALSSPGKLPSQHDTTVNKKARFVAFTVTEEGELKDTVETLKRKQRMESISNAQNRTQA